VTRQAIALCQRLFLCLALGGNKASPSDLRWNVAWRRLGNAKREHRV